MALLKVSNYGEFQEEVPVTLQVGLIAKDGWILASDRLRIDGGVRVRSQIRKVICNEALGLSYSFYGDDCSIIAGDLLAANAEELRKMDDQRSLRLWLMSLGNRTMAQVNEPLPMHEKIPSSHLYRGLLFFLASVPTHFWFVQIGSPSCVSEVFDKVVVGDGANSARFFVEHYYSPEMSVKDVAFLAAHTITVGSMLNPAGVGGGMDIIVCEAGTMRPLSEDETRDLETESRKRDARIGRYFRS